MSFSVLGTGSCVPARVVTNDELSTFLDTSDEWISQRVGIRERHVCTTETPADLAVEAARIALENSGTTPKQLDMIICATVSSDNLIPSLACLVQMRLGATCPAMDINAACSGFIYGLDTAAGFFERKRAKKMLVVGAERLSRIVDWTQRETCVIFGDGAGAAVLGEGNDYLSSHLTTMGDDVTISASNFIGKSPFFKGEEKSPYVSMNGAETYKFAVNSLCNDIERVAKDAGIKIDDIKYIVPHQANSRIIYAAQKRLGVPKERFVVNIDRYGNTSAASVPLALDELAKSGKLNRGDILALSAFGGGLTSAACIIKW